RTDRCDAATAEGCSEPDAGRTAGHVDHRSLRAGAGRRAAGQWCAHHRCAADVAGGNIRGQRDAQPRGGAVMKSSVFWALVRKDIYVLRGFMIITVAVGLAALVGMRFGRIGFAIGGILFLTANVAGGIFIAMYSLLTERKEQSNLFALSLPISGFKYDLAKLVSGYVGYGIPWSVLTAIGLAGYFMPYAAADRGMFVYGLVLQLFVMALFSFVLVWLFVVASEVLAGLVILI